LTYADIAVANGFDFFDYPTDKGYEGLEGMEDRFKVLDNFPLLAKHRAMVNGLPGIKEFLEKRPVTPL
jgi:hypothetical protein